MLVGLAFAPVFKVLGRKFSIPVSLVLTTVCVAMAAVSSNAIVIMVAVAFSGFALFIIWPASIMEFGEICPSDRMAFASGLFFAFLNVGGFLASPYMGIIAAASNNPSPRLPLVVSAVIIAIVTVLWSILILGHKKGQTHMADSKPVE